MIRSVASKVMWVGRATVFVVGLSVLLALVFGAVTTALGATGGNFILGKANGAGAVSKLTANVVGPALNLVNNSTASTATALNLQVASGHPPLTVSSSAGKATNLNADKVDGRDAPLWAVVDKDGTAVRGAGLNFSFRPNAVTHPGQYIVSFDRDITSCSYTATIFRSSSGGFFPEGSAIEIEGNTTDTTRLAVFTSDRTGNEAERPFHVQVIC